nr:MAG TPA: hypothetical protein [Caudoviricetes sp.]DAK73174.1 MAG TPA: hypothetical protein [Bacteriophage sp.]
MPPFFVINHFFIAINEIIFHVFAPGQKHHITTSITETNTCHNNTKKLRKTTQLFKVFFVKVRALINN